MTGIQFKRGASEEAVPPLKPGEPAMLGGHLYVADAAGVPVKLATATEVEAVRAESLPLSGGTLEGSLTIPSGALVLGLFGSSPFLKGGEGVLYVRGHDWGDPRINGIGAPTESLDAANKEYVDSKVIVAREVYVKYDLWTMDTEYSEQGYRYRIDLDVPGVTENHVPDVTFYLQEAISGNFAPIASAHNGYISIYGRELLYDFYLASVVCARGD